MHNLSSFIKHIITQVQKKSQLSDSEVEQVRDILTDAVQDMWLKHQNRLSIIHIYQYLICYNFSVDEMMKISRDERAKILILVNQVAESIRSDQIEINELD